MIDQDARFSEGSARMEEAGWNREECAGNPFHLAATLASGQTFRWQQDACGVWWGVVEETVIAVWQENGDPTGPLYWQTFPEPNRRAFVRDYFRLDVSLPALYEGWIAAEPHMAAAIAAFRGLRILRQPPTECFFAFQCATCNTVVKIERSVRKLAQRYGAIVPVSPEQSSAFPGSFYAFPTVAALAAADEQALRADLWGYRASRVIALARHLQTLPPDWLISLRSRPAEEIQAELIALHGIGAKIADCISLFALDKDEVAPIDTHTRQIAVRLFRPDLASCSLTPRVYTALRDEYHSRFGAYAGWAQQYLFFAELRRASDLIHRDTVGK
jgi:N-glycosylase/DNA lyase